MSLWRKIAVEKNEKIIIEEKISNGKLLYIYFLEPLNKEKIGKIQICGDFFLHPEEKIEEIERIVEMQKITITEDELSKLIEKVIEKSEVVGFNANDISRLVKRGRKQ